MCKYEVAEHHDLTTDPNEVDNMMEVDNSRQSLHTGAKADEGFYAFENQMSRRDARISPKSFSAFAFSPSESEYVPPRLRPMGTKRSSIFFGGKDEAFLLRMQHLQPGYDKVKALTPIIWEIPIDWIEGYRGYDVIEKINGAI